MATVVDYPLLTAEDFLDIDFGDRKAELDNGVIRMMAGGTARHARVQFNLLLALGQRLRGRSFTPHTSAMATRTHDYSVRYPDVTVFYGHDGSEDDDAKAFADPRLLFEMLSARTARTDLRVKLDEYKALPSVAAIVFIDIAAERLRVVERTGPHGWSDVAHDELIDLVLPPLDLILPHAEIFARD
jgi:Uma2 family endonuclease